ncbi:MAG: DUF3035 domain-containing protein [Alphaproteobacteria bacterium]|nr:DUF3035 domain-containing protein [Alphaproteobacteria bacterium]
MIRRPRRLAGPVALALVGVLALGGCAETRKALGWEKSAPDEFRIVSRAPLALPPDYGLRPPAPGAARPNEATPQDAARTAVFGTEKQTASVLNGAGSAGERTLLTKMGAEKADPNIRDTIDRETQSLAEADRSFVDRLIFWREPETPGSKEQLDAAREAQRLREVSAAGKPVNAGELPTIKKRQRGWLEGIF